MSTLFKEVFLSVTCVVLAGLVYWSADQVPPSLLATVSAGLVPKVLSATLAVLAVLHLAVMFFKSELAAPVHKNHVEPRSFGPSSGQIRVTLLLLLICGYVAALNLALLAFTPASIIFVFAVVLLMTGLSRRNLFIAVITSGISVSITVFVFTKIFTVILP